MVITTTLAAVGGVKAVRDRIWYRNHMNWLKWKRLNGGISIEGDQYRKDNGIVYEGKNYGSRNYSSMEKEKDTEHALFSKTSARKAVKTKRPITNKKAPSKISTVIKTTSSPTKPKKPRKAKPMESSALKKMRKWKRIVVYFKAKKDVAAGGTGLVNWTSGDEAKYAKAMTRHNTARKMAAPELIKNLMKKRASRGRGKKRGSSLGKLGNKN